MNESWDYVAASTTGICKSLHGVRINSQDLRKEMLIIVNDLKRISNGSKPMSDRYRSNGELT